MPQTHFSTIDLLEDFSEHDMTFQVALTSPQGLVLASDRLIVERGLRGFLTNQHSYQRAISKKIVLSDNRDVICAFAGGPYAGNLARHIATNCRPNGLSDLQWHTQLEAEVKQIPQYQEPGLDELLVIRCDTVTALKIMRQNSENPTFTPIDPFLFTGGDKHARTIPELFWHSSIDLEHAAILAVLTVNHARIETPQLVGGGVDVLKVDVSGNISEHYYSDNEAEAIRTAFIQKFRDL
jgi:hypothetical protein